MLRYNILPLVLELLSLTTPSTLLCQAPTSTAKAFRRNQIRAMGLPTYPLLHIKGGPPIIDGSLQDWPKGLPAIILDDPRQLSGTAHKSWKGKKDFGGRGALLWDKNFLYLGFFIIDDWPRPLLKRGGRGAGLPPSGDSIQFRFDPLRNSRRVGPDEGRIEDIEYWFGIDKKKKTRILVSRRYLDISILDSESKAVMLYDSNRHVYTLEARIPWKEILPSSQKPGQGQALDLQIILSDFDAITDPLPQTRIGWTFGMGPIIDPMIYGTIILEGKDWNSSQPPKAPPLPKSQATKLNEAWCEKIENFLSTYKPKPLAGKRELKDETLLHELDDALAAWPRQDVVEFLILTQRRMNREVSGYLRTGVMRVLRERVRHILKLMEMPPPNLPRIHSLPGRGWWIESKEGNFFIDPSFPLFELFHQKVQACLLSRAQSPLLRSDPLAFRLVATKKLVICHVAFHLGGAGPLIVHPLDPGDRIEIGKGVTVILLGKKGNDGRVTMTTGFQMTWPSGFTIVAPSLSGTPKQVKHTNNPIDVLLLDPSNPKTTSFIDELKPRDVILEGFFDLQRFPIKTFPKSHRLAETKDLLLHLKKIGSRLWVLPPGSTWKNNK